ESGSPPCLRPGRRTGPATRTASASGTRPITPVARERLGPARGGRDHRPRRRHAGAEVAEPLDGRALAPSQTGGIGRRPAATGSTGCREVVYLPRTEVCRK